MLRSENARQWDHEIKVLPFTKQTCKLSGIFILLLKGYIYVKKGQMQVNEYSFTCVCGSKSSVRQFLCQPNKFIYRRRSCSKPKWSKILKQKSEGEEGDLKMHQEDLYPPPPANLQTIGYSVNFQVLGYWVDIEQL